MTGIELIAKERQEQIEKHGRTIEQDVKYNNFGQLVDAAKWLLDADQVEPEHFDIVCPLNWNKEIWRKMISKPFKERSAIAGALIAAELDRLNALNQ